MKDTLYFFFKNEYSPYKACNDITGGPSPDTNGQPRIANTVYTTSGSGDPKETT